MDILCQTCETKLNIPDEKLPEGRVVNIQCPKCNSKLSIDTETMQGKPQMNPNPEPSIIESGVEDKEDSPESIAEIPTIEMTMGEVIELIEEGEKRALICDDKESNQDMLKSALKELGYRVDIGMDPKSVLDTMRFNNYDVIVLNERFGTKPSLKNPVLNHIQPMPIAYRRNIFFVLIGKEYKTFDNMTAFSKSVNLVINQKDLTSIKTILKKSILDNEKFYKALKETLIASGRS